MNKKIYLIILCIIFIIFGVLIWAYFNSDKEVINYIDEIIPEEEITDLDLRNTAISLYYLDEETGEMKGETRRLDSKELLENPYYKILNLWLEGSKENNLITGVSDEIKINNIEKNNNCCIIDFNEKFISDINNEKIDELKIIYCIVNTLTELTEIDCVKILINGEENIYWNNINLSEKYFRLN